MIQEGEAYCPSSPLAPLSARSQCRCWCPRTHGQELGTPWLAARPIRQNVCPSCALLVWSSSCGALACWVVACVVGRYHGPTGQRSGCWVGNLQLGSIGEKILHVGFVQVLLEISERWPTQSVLGFAPNIQTCSWALVDKILQVSWY